MMCFFCFLAGLISIVVGVALVSIPGAWIAGGAGLIVLAMILAKAGGSSS